MFNRHAVAPASQQLPAPLGQNVLFLAIQESGSYDYGFEGEFSALGSSCSMKSLSPPPVSSFSPRTLCSPSSPSSGNLVVFGSQSSSSVFRGQRCGVRVFDR